MLNSGTNTLQSFFNVYRMPYSVPSNMIVYKRSNFVDSNVPEGIEFDIPPVSASFIHQQLQNLKVNKATGVDDISAKYLKLSASVISQPLATILNLSITSSIYPDDLKKAKVTPILNKKRYDT